MLKCFQSAGNTVNPVCGYNEPTKSLRQPIPTGSHIHLVCLFLLLFQGMLPVRWMALESLEDYTYNTKTDV